MSTHSPRIRSINFGFDRFSGLYMWAFFIVVFGIWNPGLFLTSATLHIIASQQAVIAMLALGAMIPLVGGSFDLSVGATINFSTVVVTVLQSDKHWNMWPAILVAVCVGVLIGFVNGFLVVKLRISSIIATLGTTSVITAFQSIVSGDSQPLPPTSAGWATLTQYKIFGFQVVILYLIILALIVWWALRYTPAGRYLYAIGGNEEAARLSGVAVGRWVWLSLIASGTICAVAGVFYASLVGPSLTFGPELLLPAFAAAFLGSTQLTPGRFNVWGSLIAIYVLATGVQGLELVTGVQWLQDMFNGIALLAAVGFAVWRQRAMAGTAAGSGTGRDRWRRLLRARTYLPPPGAEPTDAAAHAAGGDATHDVPI